MKPIKSRFLIILFLTLSALYAIAPTVIYFMEPKELRNNTEYFAEKLPSWLPKDNLVKLGLDLQGGVLLVIGVDTKNSIETRLSSLSEDMKTWAKTNELPLMKSFVKEGSGKISVSLQEGADFSAFHLSLRKEFPSLHKIGSGESELYYSFNEDEVIKIEKSAREQAERVVRNRVNQWGVSDVSVFRRQDGSIMVQLPGFENPEQARKLLGRTAKLEFKMVDDSFREFDNLQNNTPEGVSVYRAGSSGTQTSFASEDKEALIKFLSPHVSEERQLLFGREEIGSGNNKNKKKKYRWVSYVLHSAVRMTGSDIKDASITSSIQGVPTVALSFTGPGSRRFADLSGQNVGKRMAIVLDNIVEQAPVFKQKIANGSASIELGRGSYQETVEEGTQLAMILKAGAVPATFSVLEQRQVGASLGPELANQGVRGILIGLMCVLLFMFAYYRKPGFIACLALVLNAIFMIAIMAGFGFALTLPGIAGVVLTLGMAVDANVLINERIRQELREGRNPKKAVEVAFGRVFWTIVDSNITTLIAALVLLETSGSGPIRGFAVTIMIGLVVSLFTCLYCTRLFFDIALVRVADEKMLKWLYGKKPSKNKTKISINFIKLGRVFSAMTVGVVFVILVGVVVKGVNLGVDFKGGTEVTIGFSKDVIPSKVREVASSSGLDGFSLQALDGGKRNYLLRYDEGQKEDGSIEGSAIFKKLNSNLDRLLSDSNPQILEANFVGAQVGKELRNQGLTSMLLSILLVMLYIVVRFDMRFAPGVFVKMFLDMILMLGFYVFFGATFDLVAVAAFLTVVGYSVNDTIVIYDRIRENMSLYPRRDLRENINFSLNETLSRTINTSLTTMVSLLGIVVLGTGSILEFAVALIIGVVAATFSSTFIASSFVYWWEDIRKVMLAKKTRVKN